MAHQPPVGAVICHRHTAARTFRNSAAFTAQQHPRAAAPVQKQDALFPARNIFLQLRLQNGADDTAVSFLQLLPHIGNARGGKAFGMITPVK